MSRYYREPSRQLQDTFDTRRLADRIEEVLARDALGADDAALIESADCFFLATVDGDGQPQCSYKGGEPGFVRVLDERTIAFPSYDGNGMFLSLGNVRETGRVGMLFVDFAAGRRLRVNGAATVALDDPLLADLTGAQAIVRVRTTHVFPNCGRYVHRLALVERSRFTPRAGCEAPVPEWKRAPWSRDALPRDDPARTRPPHSD